MQVTETTMTGIRHAPCTTTPRQMISWRSIATSLAVAAALLLSAMASGCGGGNAEERARRHAAERLGVPVDDLRVTERSDLSTSRHVVLRVSAHDQVQQLTVAVSRKGDLLVDGLQPDAFTRLAKAERLGRRFDELGGTRVAGWFGALAGGHPCGEPISPSPQESVQTEKLPDGSHRLSYRFTDGSKLMRCRLTIAPDGTVRDAVAEAAPVAKR
jgi:hypothetical protein